MLNFYDSNRDLSVANVTSHIGNIKSIHETVMYLRNNDPARYYTGIRVYAEAYGGDELALLNAEGWTVKMIAGDRRPTEAEWGALPNFGQYVDIPNVGNDSVGDTSTYQAFWLRVVAPATAAAGFRQWTKLRWAAVQGTVNG
jgi:hypothetical protein